MKTTEQYYENNRRTHFSNYNYLTNSKFFSELYKWDAGFQFIVRKVSEE